MSSCMGTSCCGLYELYGFNEYSDNDVDQGLRGNRQYGVIATTVSDQLSAIRQLKAQGFVLVDTFRNPNTGRTISLWFRNPKQPRKTPVKKRPIRKPSAH